MHKAQLHSIARSTSLEVIHAGTARARTGITGSRPLIEMRFVGLDHGCSGQATERSGYALDVACRGRWPVVLLAVVVTCTSPHNRESVHVGETSQCARAVQIRITLARATHTGSRVRCS